ncbi:MAG TPA: hypothetical protein VF060_01495 [Trebonia sp.]
MRVDHPEPADRPSQPTADHPLIPNGSPRLPSDHPPPDIPDIPKTADYRAAVDAAYREYAIDHGCTRVREIEEHVVTPAMRRIESEDPDRHLVGLDHRLKGKARLTDKVTEAMEERGHSAEEAFRMVKDAIRYTFQYPESAYTQSVHADCDRLKAAGFDLIDRKNSWEHAEYKGINSRWRDPGSGQTFEVQFHTQASFEAKQETHLAYERLRSHPDNEDEVRQLRAYQREVSAKIPVPPGAPGIPSYRREA